MLLKLSINTGATVEFRDITPDIRKAAASSGLQDGICYVFVPHTTAGVTLNEHADPDVIKDIAASLEKLVPATDRYRHTEGNSPAHIKASLMGSTAIVCIQGGQPVLGTWQGVFLCEFDGPRHRTVILKFIPG